MLRKRSSSPQSDYSSTSYQEDEDEDHDFVEELPADEDDEEMEEPQEGQEFSLADYQERKRSHSRWITLLVLLLLGCTVAVLIVLLKRNKEDTPEPRFTSSSSIPPSYFNNPTVVEWKLQGTVILDDLSTNKQPVSYADGIFAFEIDLSSDGKKLVVGSLNRGYALLYDYNETSEDWEFHTRFASSAQGAADDLQNGRRDFGREVALSGAGKSLAIGGNGVSMYGYNDTSNEWNPLYDQIAEYQEDDGTGLGVDLNFDGNVLAVGSPFFDGESSRIGMIRVFKNVGAGGWKLASIVQGNGTAAIVGTGVRLSADASTVVDGNSYENTENGPQSGAMRSWRYDSDIIGENSTWTENWSPLGQILNGPSAKAFFGSYNDINDDGSVIATASQNQNAFVYELVSGQWQLKGGVLETASATLASGTCLSADGNFVVVSTYQRAYAFQYDPENNVTESSWVPVGTFPTDARFGSRVSCSSDGRIIAIGRPSAKGWVGSVSVFQAMESDE